MLLLYFSKIGFRLVEFDSIILNGFNYFFDLFLQIIVLISSLIKHIKIFLIDTINIMPIIDKLFSITQIKIHQQFFNFKFIDFILLFFSQL
jgi:hypothetical protein